MLSLLETRFSSTISMIRRSHLFDFSTWQIFFYHTSARGQCETIQFSDNSVFNIVTVFSTVSTEKNNPNDRYGNRLLRRVSDFNSCLQVDFRVSSFGHVFTMSWGSTNFIWPLIFFHAITLWAISLLVWLLESNILVGWLNLSTCSGTDRIFILWCFFNVRLSLETSSFTCCYYAYGWTSALKVNNQLVIQGFVTQYWKEMAVLMPWWSFKEPLIFSLSWLITRIACLTGESIGSPLKLSFSTSPEVIHIINCCRTSIS